MIGGAVDEGVPAALAGERLLAGAADDRDSAEAQFVRELQAEMTSPQTPAVRSSDHLITPGTKWPIRRLLLFFQRRRG